LECALPLAVRNVQAACVTPLDKCLMSGFASFEVVARGWIFSLCALAGSLLSASQPSLAFLAVLIALMGARAASRRG